MTTLASSHKDITVIEARRKAVEATVVERANAAAQICAYVNEQVKHSATAGRGQIKVYLRKLASGLVYISNRHPDGVRGAPGWGKASCLLKYCVNCIHQVVGVFTLCGCVASCTLSGRGLVSMIHGVRLLNCQSPLKLLGKIAKIFTSNNILLRRPPLRLPRRGCLLLFLPPQPVLERGERAPEAHVLPRAAPLAHHRPHRAAHARRQGPHSLPGGVRDWLHTWTMRGCHHFHFSPYGYPHDSSVISHTHTQTCCHHLNQVLTAAAK
jgi:hypothetical protein